MEHWAKMGWKKLKNSLQCCFNPLYVEVCLHKWFVEGSPEIVTSIYGMQLEI